MPDPQSLRLLPVAEIPEQQLLRHQTQDQDLLIYRRGECFHVYTNRCTHQRLPLSDGHVVDETLICRRHGAKFDLRSGACLRMPATRNLETFESFVEDGVLYIRA